MQKINTHIPEIIKNYKRIAVVGLSAKPERDSYRVALLMKESGYTVIPVNPGMDTILGEKCYPTLKDIPGEVDLVDVFRRPEYVDEIVDQAIEKGVKAVWLQLGIVNEKAARKALKNGLKVVMDRCWAIEFHALS